MPHWFFVWTIQDLVGLFFVGLVLLVLLLFGLLVAADKVHRKWNAWRQRRASQ